MINEDVPDVVNISFIYSRLNLRKTYFKEKQAHNLYVKSAKNLN